MSTTNPVLNAQGLKPWRVLAFPTGFNEISLMINYETVKIENTACKKVEYFSPVLYFH